MRTQIYFSDRQRRIFLQDAHSNGETMIHDDILDEKRSRLTFDILPKIIDPDVILYKLLLGKLENNTITIEQLKTLIRLEHGFPLTQTTRDKILIAVQGIVGTLRDRLKAVFRL